MDRFESDRVGPDSFSVVESPTVEQQRQDTESADVALEGEEGDTPGTTFTSDRAPYPVRLRVVLALSLASWTLVALIALGIGWLITRF